LKNNEFLNNWLTSWDGCCTREKRGWGAWYVNISL